jgi:hypothetical protein
MSKDWIVRDIFGGMGALICSLCPDLTIEDAPNLTD